MMKRSLTLAAIVRVMNRLGTFPFSIQVAVKSLAAVTGM
jgi:hypothetical protein